MKQSTKLLSLVLALLMAFSCMSVIGSAALARSEVNYDCIDDADLTYEQVANIAVDLVDQLLKDADIGKVVDILGLTIDLSTVDTTFSSLYSTSQNLLFKILKGLLGDIADLSFTPLYNEEKSSAYQRSHGDYLIISALVDFVGCTDNASVLSKIAYGIGTTNGVSLGSILGGLLNLGDIQDMLADIPGLVKNLVFDLIIYGSYGYDMDSDDIKEAKKTLTDVYPEMDTLDEMIPNAIYNLLTKPQNHNGYDADGVKQWEMNSVLIPTLGVPKDQGGYGLTASDINPLSNSFFNLLDKAAQIAIDEIGVPALNNNLKKALMLAVEAELDEIDVASLPADVKTAFEVAKDGTDEEKSFVTYFAYDKMKKSGGTWYYTTFETEPVIDEATDKPQVDEEGNEITAKVPKYFKVNMAAANEFAGLINWDWEFVTSAVTPGEGQTALVYDDFKAINGSFVGSLNNILSLVYEVGLADNAKADFVNAIVSSGIDDSFEGWITDPTDPYDNANINVNLEYLLKYILTEFGDKVFGADSEYANYVMEDVADMTIIEIAAMIAPGFFEDAMPQIILPKNADGTYAFHDGVQLWEFAACVIRELITGIAPIVNYDKYIFANGDVTSDKDRQFVDYAENPATDAEGNDLGLDPVETWFNIILNMGTDLACVYLGQLTNFQDFMDSDYGGIDLDKEWISLGGVDGSHWETTLDAVIFWALDYIGGERSTGILDGITYDILNTETYAHAFDKLSYILNKILPLGFVGDGTYTSVGNPNEADLEFDFDARYLVDGIKTLLTDFDLTAVLSLFGRNTASSYNMLGDASLGTAVLDLVNDIVALIFDNTLLQNVNATNSVSAQSVDNVVSQASLKTTVYNLLTGLNANKHDILKNAAPVLAKFIKEWGGEQEFNNPSHDMGQFVYIEKGRTWTESKNEVKDSCGNVESYTYSFTGAPVTVNVKNNAQGVWRHYKDASGNGHQDEQYKIQLASVNFYNLNGDPSTYIQVASVDTTTIADIGASTSFTYNVGNNVQTNSDGSVAEAAAGYNEIPEDGVVQRVKIGYKIYIEDGESMLGGGKVYYDESYVWFSKYPNNTGDYVSASAEAGVSGANGESEMSVDTMIYVPYSTATDFVNDLSPVHYSSNKGALGHPTQELSFTITGGTKHTFTPSNAPAVTTNQEDGQGAIDLYIFRTYNADWNGLSIPLTGSVGEQTAFEEALSYDDVKDADGASISWDVSGQVKDSTFSGTMVFKYYDDVYRDKLLDLVGSEVSAMRMPEDYKHKYGITSVTIDEALENEVTTDEDGNEILPETNFAPTGDQTVINTATAWNNYYNAFQAALRVALPEWNVKSTYNFKEVYDALRVAVNDIERCYATADDGAANFGDKVDALEGTLRASQARTTDIYNFTDYKMFRLNKYNAARDDVNWYINLRKDAQPSIDEIDTYFGYNWMEENDFLSLVGAHTVKYGEKAGTSVAQNKYYTYLVALLEDFSAEELEAKKAWLDGKKVEFTRISELDIDMAANILDITENRLLKRDCGIITDQLDDEILSAQNMIGTTNDGTYTADSWDNYIEAYNKAVEVAAAKTSQRAIFDAKYQLLVQRKRLVEVENAADYNELNALIANAEFALNNANLYESKYENMSVEQILGMVLAELGMDPICSVDGYDVQLFPGSAYIVLDRAYGADDQDEIDDAAAALKEALARLTFKGIAVTEIPTDTTVGYEDLIVDDKATTDVNERVQALVSHIAAGLGEDEVKEYFSLDTDSVSGFDPEKVEIVVTKDVNFSITHETSKEFVGLAGTNSTVTFYTTYNGVKLPVATVKVVVDGDINGDGAVDALDAAYGALVASEKGELEGCYLLAGDLSGNNRLVTADDFSAIVNKVVA